MNVWKLIRNNRVVSPIIDLFVVIRCSLLLPLLSIAIVSLRKCEFNNKGEQRNTKHRKLVTFHFNPLRLRLRSLHHFFFRFGALRLYTISASNLQWNSSDAFTIVQHKFKLVIDCVVDKQNATERRKAKRNTRTEW